MASENQKGVMTASGVEIPASAMGMWEELVVLLRETCLDLPMETEPGDFLAALQRNAEAEEQA